MAKVTIESQKKALLEMLESLPQTKGYYVSKQNPLRYTALKGKAENWAQGFEFVKNPSYDPKRKVSAFADENKIELDLIKPETNKVEAGEAIPTANQQTPIT